MMASSTGKVMKVLPVSQKPPYQGALLGMNFHVTPWCSNACLREEKFNSSCNSFAADKYVEALSDIIILGSDL